MIDDVFHELCVLVLEKTLLLSEPCAMWFGEAPSPPLPPCGLAALRDTVMFLRDDGGDDGPLVRACMHVSACVRVRCGREWLASLLGSRVFDPGVSSFMP